MHISSVLSKLIYWLIWKPEKTQPERIWFVFDSIRQRFLTHHTDKLTVTNAISLSGTAMHTGAISVLPPLPFSFVMAVRTSLLLQILSY